MKDICNKLLETYDTRFLDNLDKETKQIWNDTTRKTLSSKNPFIKNNANLVLSRLVQNHFNNNKPITDLLSGPMSFTLQKSAKYDMSVYIFGEYHGLKDDCKQFLKTKKGKKCKKKCKKKQICNRKTGRCINKEGKIGKEIIKNNKGEEKENNHEEMEIQDFLKELVNNTDVFLDLYFEFPQFLDYSYEDYDYLKSDARNIQYMDKIFSNFIECVQTETRLNNKNCELFRVHYIDIRKKGNDHFDSVIYKLRKSLITGQVKKNLKLLKEFTNIKKKDLLIMYNTDVKKNKYIQKELSKTPLKKEILSFCYDKIEDHINTTTINNLNSFSKEILHIYPVVNMDIIISFVSELITITGIMVDVYTLSRIFRAEFKIGERYQPKRQHNIIIQAGDCHSKVYRSFLTKLKFLTIETSGKETNMCYADNYKGDRKSTRCLELNNISQPLFN